MGAQNNENAALNNVLDDGELSQVSGGLKTNLRDNAINRYGIERVEPVINTSRPKEIKSTTPQSSFNQQTRITK